MQNSISKTFSFEGYDVSFRKGNYVMVSATEMAKPFGKKPAQWFDNPSTHEFIEALAKTRGLTRRCKNVLR